MNNTEIEHKNKDNHELNNFVVGGLFRIFIIFITAGLYMPWFLGYISEFLVASLNKEGRNLQFAGKPIKLFLPFLITYMVVFALSFYFSIVGLAATLLLMVAYIPFGFLAYKWLLSNIVYADTNEEYTPESTSIIYNLKKYIFVNKK